MEGCRIVSGLSDIVIIDGDEVARMGDYSALVDAIEAAHRRRPAAVERIVYGPEGRSERLLALPAWQADEAIGIKLVTVFPDNPSANGLPSVQAVVVLFDGSTGEPLALIDGTELTYRKTAADSALGSRFLSRHDSRTLLMVGAGGLAPHLVAAHRAVRPSIERVVVWNRTRAKAEQLVAAGVADAVADDLAAGVADADVICTATLSKDPLIRGEWLRPGTHLDCVGAFLPDHREIDDEVVRRAQIYVDSRLATLSEGGDLVIPIAAGVVRASDVRADLYELSQGTQPGRAAGDRDSVTLFENCGGGHLDLMVASYLWQARAAR
jgi:ornithine cyclodeaminase/alanine dehydrogenase-like protein (mu-crystallin family)